MKQRHSQQRTRKTAVEPRVLPLQKRESKLVQIEKPIYGGAFLSRAEGKAIFVPLTLPGEQVRVRIVEDKRGYSTAEVEEIVTPAQNRIAAECRHFGICGGCHYQHTDYESQLGFKQEILRETLRRGGIEVPEAFSLLRAENKLQSTETSWTYRNRIRLAIDANGNPGYRGRRSHAVVPIAECPIAAPLLVDASKACAEILRAYVPSSRPIELAFFCDASESALLLSVFAPNRTDFSLRRFAESLHARLPALQGAELIIEDTTQKHPQSPRTIEQWGATSLTYRTTGLDYRVNSGAFFQVNRWLVDALVEKVTAGRHGSLAWDLFAGVGLFARKLCSDFERVIAVESAPASVQSLERNLEGTTGTAVRATTLDFLRRFERAEQAEMNAPDLIVVDPPRTGLGPEVTASLAKVSAPTLVYVSCDPATLARDLRPLIASGYRIESVVLADLFPQTFHLETVVNLRRD